MNIIVLVFALLYRPDLVAFERELIEFVFKIVIIRQNKKHSSDEQNKLAKTSRHGAYIYKANY